MKDDTLVAILVVPLVVLGVFALVAASFFLGGLVLWAGWNYGVTAVADVPRLAYWPACFIGLLAGVVRRVIGRKA